MPDHGAEETVEPFIKSVYRRDALGDLASAPLVALSTRVRESLNAGNQSERKKDGKDGTAEGVLTFGDDRLILDVLRIKDDKLQSEKHKDATDSSFNSETKEACDVRQAMSTFGDPEALDLEKIQRTEELQATRLGIEVRRGSPII